MPTPETIISVLQALLPAGYVIVREGESMEKPMGEDEAAEFLHCGVDALRRHRTNGTGPLFRKVGRSVVYLPSDLLEWVQAIKPQRSTAA